MSEIKAQGRVVETRPGMVVITKGVAPGEETHAGLREHDAEPGDYVWIYDDGQVEVKGRHERVENIAVPMAPQQDHS